MKLLKQLTLLTLLSTFTLAGCSNSESPINNSENQSTVTEETQPQTTEAPTEATTKAKSVSLLESNIATFEVTSESLKDGVWDTVITNTANGKNQSPQLSWEAVEGAESYSIYMVDTSASNWSHWRSADVTETNLAQGWATEKEYVGPYPPSGTHDYEIYVFALKEQPSAKPTVMFNSGNSAFFKDIMALDKSESSESGNIISYGHIKGTYTHGD